MGRVINLVLVLFTCIQTSNAEESKKSDPKFEPENSFTVLFDGTSLDSWIGNMKTYSIENGTIAVRPGRGGEGGGGNLYTKEQYEDFIFKFEFKLTEGANNGKKSKLNKRIVK